MSKSAGNGVDPRVIINEYGADSLRLWMSFIGDYYESALWSDDGVKACAKFLNRVWRLQENVEKADSFSKELEYAFNFAIKKVTEDMDNIKFNTAVSALMTLVNEIYKVGKVNSYEYQTLITLVYPFAPHMCAELFEYMGYGKDITQISWPKYDQSKLVLNTIKLPVQILGRVRGTIEISKDMEQDEVLIIALNNPEIKKYVTGEIKKVIYVAGRILNIIV